MTPPTILRFNGQQCAGCAGNALWAGERAAALWLRPPDQEREATPTEAGLS